MRERSLEEIQGILQSFPDVFEAQTGTTLTVERLKEVVTKKLKEQEQKVIEQRFNDFNPLGLRLVLKMISEYEQPKETIVEPKKKGRPKRD